MHLSSSKLVLLSSTLQTFALAMPSAQSNLASCPDCPACPAASACPTPPTCQGGSSSANSSATSSLFGHMEPALYQLFNQWPTEMPMSTRIGGQQAAQITWTGFTSPPTTSTRVFASAYAWYLQTVYLLNSLNVTNDAAPAPSNFYFQFGESQLLNSTSRGGTDFYSGSGWPGVILQCPAGGQWPNKQFFQDVLTAIIGKVQAWGFTGVNFSVTGNDGKIIVAGCSMSGADRPLDAPPPRRYLS